MRNPRFLLLLALAAAVGLGLLGAQAHGFKYPLGIAEKAGILAVLAVSLNLVLGHTGQFSLGHAGFMSVGAFAAAAFTNFSGAPTHGLWTREAMFLPALAAGGLAAAVAGLAVGVPCLRLKGDYLAIVTLGFGEILRNLLTNAQHAIHADDALGEKLPWVTAAAVKTAPQTSVLPTLGWTLATVALAVYACRSLVKSSYGLAFHAVRDNEVAAEACGVSAARAKITAFVVGAFFAGAAGALFIHFKGSASPDDFDFTRSMEVVLIVILGGCGNDFGAVLAAVAITLFSEGLGYAKDIPGVNQSPKAVEILQSREFFFALILIALMILRPQGLFAGWKLPWKRKEAAQ